LRSFGLSRKLSKITRKLIFWLNFFLIYFPQKAINCLYLHFISEKAIYFLQTTLALRACNYFHPLYKSLSVRESIFHFSLFTFHFPSFADLGILPFQQEGHQGDGGQDETDHNGDHADLEGRKGNKVEEKGQGAGKFR
jgi:hypothetical protein